MRTAEICDEVLRAEGRGEGDVPACSRRMDAGQRGTGRCGSGRAMTIN